MSIGEPKRNAENKKRTIRTCARGRGGSGLMIKISATS